MRKKQFKAESKRLLDLMVNSIYTHKEIFLKFRQEQGEEAAGDTDIIGQFGVGFYSAFMVADHITVVTRKYGETQAWKWESSGAEGYTVTEAERDAVGTDIIMHIKPDGEEPGEFSR